jgi:hypothetical protein
MATHAIRLRVVIDSTADDGRPLGRTCYEVTRLPGPLPGWRLDQADGPRADAVYTVSHDGRGWRCTCPAFVFRKDRGLVCKHLEACLALVVVVESPTPPPPL